MIKTAFTILMVAASILGMAQDSTSHERLTIKFSLLAVANLNTPCLQPGLEYRFLPKWSIQAEYGFQANKIPSYSFHDQRHDWKYYRIKTELMHYLPSRKADRILWGIEYFKVGQTYSKLNGILYLPNGAGHYSYSRSDIRRNSWGLMGKFGFSFWNEKRFWGEVVIGLGYKKLSIRHNLYDPVFDAYTSLREFSFARDLEAADWHSIHFSYELKFGYILLAKASHQ